MSLLVKICGLTVPDEAAACAALGADAIGINLWPGSRRCVSVAQAARIAAAARAARPQTLIVGVFVNAAPAEVLAAPFIDVIQLHGDEPAAVSALYAGHRLWKGLRLGCAADLAALDDFTAPAWERVVIDAPSQGYGGSGRRIDLALAAQAAARRSVLLAGGLTPDNVARCVRAVRPAGVDVASGVESAPGRKDLELVAAFLNAARGA